MRYRWTLFYDGACPLCFKTQKKIHNLIPHVKLTAVDLNSPIAKSKNYSIQQVVLETPQGVFYGYDAWLKILSESKYKYLTHILLRPFFIAAYFLINKNRKIIGRFLNK